MIIKCTLSVSLESIRYYGRQFSELPPLPDYIIKNGPYVNNKEGRAHQIITIYQFDVSKFTEAWDCISKQLEAFRMIPGFTLSVRILKKIESLKGTELAQTKKGLNHPPNPSQLMNKGVNDDTSRSYRIRLLEPKYRQKL